MHTRPLSALLVVVAAATLAAQNQGRRGGQLPEMKNFSFKEESFQSTAVNNSVPYGVFLPKGYDEPANKDTKWPLVVWLHGMWEDHMRFATRGGALELDRAVSDGKLPPCVFVTANGGRTSMYVNRKEERWQDLITEDLLTHLSKTYRVSDKREQRALMGVSLGGMAALRIAFTKPELFGAVAVHSSAIFDADPEKLPERVKSMSQRLGLDEVFGNPIQKDAWEKANPLTIAMTLEPKTLHGLRIYFDAGTNDRMGLDRGNKELDAALTKRGIEHTWRLIEGGGHSWGDNFQGEALPHSFEVVGAMFQGKEAPKAGEPKSGDKAEKDGKGAGHDKH